MNETLDFTGKVVLVVGGTSGIGNGVAQAFLERGATVHVWGTRDRENYRVEDGSNLAGLHFDKVDVSEDNLLKTLKLPFKQLDVLVLTQGTVEYGQREFEMESFRRVVDVNLTSVMACCTRFRDMLGKSGGSIVIFGSIAGFNSRKGNPAYSASKAGVINLTRTLADAWARYGIRVNSIAPGLVATKLTTVTTDHPERYNAQLKLIPMRRAGTPKDMAGPTLFLASEMAGYITGQTIVVDGGRQL